MFACSQKKKKKMQDCVLLSVCSERKRRDFVWFSSFVAKAKGGILPGCLLSKQKKHKKKAGVYLVGVYVRSAEKGGILS